MPDWSAWPFPTDDPYPAYRAARERGAVLADEGLGAHLILSFDAARQVLGSPDWSSNPRTSPELLAQLGGEAAADFYLRSMLTSDPPEHTRLRAAANRFFIPRTMAGLRDRIDAIVDEALVPLQDGEPVELMGEIAYPLTIAVIAELFDIGVDGAEVLREETPTLARILDLDPTPAILEDVSTAALNIMLYLVPLVAERRKDPGQDLLSVLLADETLSTDEVITTCLVLLAAGHETTATLIGNATAALLDHPEQLRTLAGDPDQSSAATEELLRYDPPAQVVQRIARDDLRIDDVTIQAGDLALVVIGAANRDPARHPDPDRLRIDRSPATHLALGHGAHFCLGAGLARLEIQQLLRKLPGTLRDYPQHAEINRDTSPTFRRIQSLRLLPQSLDRRPSSRPASPPVSESEPRIRAGSAARPR